MASSVSALFVASPWKLRYGAREQTIVDIDGAGHQVSGYALSARKIAAPNGSRQPVSTFIGFLDSFILRTNQHNRHDGTAGFFLHDSHRMIGIKNYSRFKI